MSITNNNEKNQESTTGMRIIEVQIALPTGHMKANVINLLKLSNFTLKEGPKRSYKTEIFMTDYTDYTTPVKKNSN